MSTQRAMLGPCVIETVPIRTFSKIRGRALESAWQMVGPSAELNVARGPLWVAIAAAYIEGLNHGALTAAQAQGGGA